MSSLLKDLSGVFLPPGLLTKSDLTPEEAAIVQQHPLKSYELLTKFSEIKDGIANVVLAASRAVERQRLSAWPKRRADF